MADTIPIDSLAKARVEQRDEKHLSPSDRAGLVNTLVFEALGLNTPSDIITNPLYWDILCYCTEMLNLYVRQIGDESTINAMKYVNHMIYSYHYSVPDDSNVLGPPKESHAQVWLSRIEALAGGRDEQSPS